MRSGSLSLSECHKTCQALMPSNLLPNTHCRLSFKSPQTVRSGTSTPLSLPLSELLFLLSLPPHLCLSHTGRPFFFLSVKPSACLHQSLKLHLWVCWVSLLTVVHYLSLVLDFLKHIFHLPVSAHFSMQLLSFYLLRCSQLLKLNLMLPISVA